MHPPLVRSLSRAVLLLVPCLGLVSPASAAPAAIEDSVVKIFATMRWPSPFGPWSKQAPQDSTGSGVVIAGNRILTNAHCVLYASQVHVQANRSGERIAATVEAIAPGIDLALLKLEDESLFATRRPLHLETGRPAIKDTVLTYGYPTGGSELSITKGIISRIEYTYYNPGTFGLRVQIDAALNPGNSGGPAVVGDRLIGLAFCVRQDAENIGYVIPAEEIRLFLADVADGRYEGKPVLEDEFQNLENPALRDYLHLAPDMRGVVVRRPAATTTGYPLREWDVVTRIGDTPLDNNGMVVIGDGLRVDFRYLVQSAARAGRLPLTVVRAGREYPVEAPVAVRRPGLVNDLQECYPPFFVLGPIAFTKANLRFAFGLVGNRIEQGLRLARDANPLLHRIGDLPTSPDEELVVACAPFFPHRLAKGYDNPQGSIVKTVNGVAIRNLAHLVEVVRDNRDEFVVIEFAQRNASSLVFLRSELLAATDEILADNGVRAQASPELLEVWNAKPAR